jgi:hypothetical protein
MYFHVSHIDEKGVFDLNSDHVIISVKLREITQILKKQDSYSGIKHFWKLTDDTDWELFRCNLKDNFLLYGRVLLCKRCSRLASRLRFKILSRPLSQKFL